MQTESTQGEVGTIYLLHLSSPLGHAKHYLGWTTNLDRRLNQHRRGLSGARFMEVVAERGISFSLARTWQGTRSQERSKKARGKSRECPICRQVVQ